MRGTRLNYYQILGISESATTSDIKKQYRLLSKRYHPDTPTGDEQKMAQINAAYEVLSDPIRRHYYAPPQATTATAQQTVRTTKPRQTPSSQTTYTASPQYKNTYQKPRRYNQPRYANSCQPATQHTDLRKRLFAYGFGVACIWVFMAYLLPHTRNTFVLQTTPSASANSSADTPSTDGYTNYDNQQGSTGVDSATEPNTSNDVPSQIPDYTVDNSTVPYDSAPPATNTTEDSQQSTYQTQPGFDRLSQWQSQRTRSFRQ